MDVDTFTFPGHVKIGASFWAWARGAAVLDSSADMSMAGTTRRQRQEPRVRVSSNPLMSLLLTPIKLMDKIAKIFSDSGVPEGRF